MADIIKIDKAISDTLRLNPHIAKTYPIEIFKKAAYSNIPFTIGNPNSPQGTCVTVDSKELIEYFVKQAAIISGATIDYLRNLDQANPIVYYLATSNEEAINSLNSLIDITNRIISNLDINSIMYFQSNQNDLLELINSVFKIRFNHKWYEFSAPLNKIIGERGENFRSQLDRVAAQSTYTNPVISKIERDILNIKAKEVKVNQAAVNRCLREVLNGSQVKSRKNDYSLEGKMFVSQDVGLKRPNQEDSALIMTHPEQPQLKLIAVADGMGGGKLGEEISNRTLRRLAEWFSKLPVSSFNYSTKDLIPLLNNFLKQVNAETFKLYDGEGATTIVGGIIGKFDTLIFNVGDSRAYTLKNKTLSLKTLDDSPAFQTYLAELSYEKKKGTAEGLDNLRKSPYIHYINKSIGGQERISGATTTVINNNTYDRLLLFSDGVHDILSQEEIRILSLSTPVEEVTKNIVESAKSRTPSIQTTKEEQEFRMNVAGKDNITAAAYIRR